MTTNAADDFTTFVEHVGARLRQAFVAAYGPEVGAEAMAEALAYGWEHWDRIREMHNPAGYLYRVGQSKARRYRRRPPVLPPVPETHLPWIEPSLPKAMVALSEKQRLAVVLCHGYSWTLAEAAGLLDVTPSTIQRHLDRGLAKMRRIMGVSDGS